MIVTPLNRIEDWSATPAWEILLWLWDESYSTSGMAPAWLPLSRHPEEKRHGPARTGSGLPTDGAEGHGGAPGGRRRSAPLLHPAALPRSRYINRRFQSAYYADPGPGKCSRSGAGIQIRKFLGFRIRIFPSSSKKKLRKTLISLISIVWVLKRLVIFEDWCYCIK